MPTPAPYFIVAAGAGQPGGAVVVRSGPPEQWVSASVAARVLGKSVDTAYRWIQEGTLPAQLPDGTRVFKKRTPKLWEFNLPALEQIQQRRANGARGKAMPANFSTSST